MVAPRLRPPDARRDLDARRAQPRVALPATPDSGSSIAETTRATPAATMASAQGGVLP